MACRLCQNVSRLTLRHGGARDLVDSYHHATSSSSSSSSSSLRRALRASAPIAATPSQQARRIHASAAGRQAAAGQKPPGPPPPAPSGDDGSSGGGGSLFLARDLAKQLAKRAGKTTQSTYAIYGASEQIYKTVTGQAAYEITEKDREAGKVTLGPDGEEVGTGGGMWHDDFKLLPTFSTWSQVTMLHLYVLMVRLRCLDKDVYQNWQAQLIDHFFHEAETKMDLCHGMQSRALRQRNLQDLFRQWRGLILAHDEGLAKGDAVLAAAVWRNLFKGRPDVDLRALAAVVSWVRLCLKNLDHMPDESLHLHMASVFKWPARNELAGVDRPAAGLHGLYTGTTVKEGGNAAKA